MRRAWLLLLLLPLGADAAPAEPNDLIVVLAAPMEGPAGAIPLTVFPAYVVPAASAGLEAKLRADPRVESVHRAMPLAPTSAADPNLQLTRADPPPSGPVGPLTGRGVTVAVLDSGIDASHPDLAGRVKANVRLVSGRFVESPGDPDGHGTHVAGLVAASGASSEGRYRGIAPGASLVGIDISDRFTTASALLAYDWLFVHRGEYDIDVVVNAWGRVGDRTFDPSDPNVRAIDRLVDAGVVVLFSASNHGPAASTLSVEAQDPRVITVGAVDVAARLATYSSRGPVLSQSGATWVKPDVVAPGDRIVGLRSLQAAPHEGDVDALHRTYSGTSQSVPHVAGIVALMLEADPTLTPTAVQNALRESAIDLGAPGPDDATGFGLVDAVDAVRRARGLQPDRGNVLVAGGVDRFEDAARVEPTSRGGILGLGGAPTGEWTTSFPVKTGATQLLFELSWPTPSSSVSVMLARDGEREGTWSRSEVEGARVVVRGRVDAPEPGEWTVRARGSTPIAVDVASVVDVQIQANASRALELDSRYRLPDAPASSAAFETAFVQAKLFLRAYPGAVPSAAAGFLLALLVLGKRR